MESTAAIRSWACTRATAVLLLVSVGALADGPTARIPPDQAPESGRGLLRLDWDVLTPPKTGLAPKQLLRINIGATPGTLDPHAATSVPESRVLRAVYEGLTLPHPKTLRPVPAVAEWWEISSDRQTYTFHLRANAAWSDGSTLTAGDFVRSWQRAVGNPKHAFRFLFDDIAGVEDAKQRTGSLRVMALDPRTLRVTLKHPAPWFLTLLSQPVFFPVHSQCSSLGSNAFVPGRCISNGAFRFVPPKDGWLLNATANPRYWAADRVRLTRVEWLMIDDPEEAVVAYESGEVDWIGALPPPRVGALRDRKDYFNEPYGGTYYLRINARDRPDPRSSDRRHPLADPRVRRALNLAVDRGAICGALASGPAPAHGFVPPGFDGYTAYTTLRADEGLSRELLAQAGFAGGRGVPPLRYIYNDSPSHRRIAELVRSQLSETLGLTVVLHAYTWAQYLDHVQNGRFDLARSGWIADFPNPHSFLQLFATGDVNGSTGWSDAQYDAALVRARNAVSPRTRANHLRAAETILLEGGGPAIPLYYYVAQGLKRPTLRGWYANVNDEHPLRFVWISKK